MIDERLKILENRCMKVIDDIDILTSDIEALKKTIVWLNNSQR